MEKQKKLNSSAVFQLFLLVFFFIETYVATQKWEEISTISMLYLDMSKNIWEEELQKEKKKSSSSEKSLWMKKK